MSYTKGEWDVEPSDCMTAHYVLRNAYDYFEEGYQSDDPQTAIALRQEDEANARLIAAAPDLLDACKYYKEKYTGTEPSVSVLSRLVDEAIAKAEKT